MRNSIFGLLATTAIISFSAPAHAQNLKTSSRSAADAPTIPGEIIVTARKVQESLIDAPLAITAFTAEAIEQAGFADLSDISLQTPGFQFHNQGGQEPGRYNTQLRFRGMNTNQLSPSFATGALFVDGVYVLNGGSSVSLLDVERVEVIKGPQSAQFGRNTFGGAVNFITRNPDLNEVHGEFDALLSSRGRVDLQALVEAPLIPGILSASVGGRLYDKRGEYTATDGGRLGNEQTKSVSAVLYLSPSSNFSAKIRGFYSEDDDDAPAGGFIDGTLNDSCSGQTITAPTGQQVTPSRYICGALPDIDQVNTINGQKLISSNTTIYQAISQGAVNVGPNFASDFFATTPQPSGLPSIRDVGLRRDILRLSGSLNFNTAGWNFDLIGGINRQRANSIRDSDVTDTFGRFSNDPQHINDESIEFRISTPTERRLRAMAGVNYYQQEFISNGGGGAVALYCVVFSDTENFNNCAIPFLSPSNFGGSDKTRVLGLFGSVEFDVTEQLTLSLEGRQQRDELIKGGTVSPSGVGATAISEVYKKFLPRAIVRWEPSDMTTLYASYAIGAIPGDVNAEFLGADARERAQYVNQFPQIGTSTGQEVLNAWEVGWKQRVFDNKLYFGLSGYFYDWSNVKGRVTGTINKTCRRVAVGLLGCDPRINPGAVVGQGEMVRDISGTLVPFFRGSNVLLAGDARIYGAEIETRYSLSNAITLSANFAWAHARYKDYEFNFVQPIAGFSQQRGNVIPRSSEFSGNVSATWSAPISNTLDGFFRADAIYFGKAYVDESNLAYAKPYTLVNVRGGFKLDNLRIEAFVNNLFGEDRYAAAARWSNFSRPVNFSTFTKYQGVNVAPQNKREVGMRLIANF